MPQDNLAPIALFTFKRPEHTRRTLESLAGNPEFNSSPLYIFCDGARREDERAAVEASREVVRGWNHPNKKIIEASKNLGLANSIIAGVTRLCDEYGKVIVMEDDLLVSPVFLDYMNNSLDQYRENEEVFQVTGHMWPVDVECEDDAFLVPLSNSLGWGTWQRAWKKFDVTAAEWSKVASDPGLRSEFDLRGRFPFASMMERQLRGQTDSWAIRWYLTVFLSKALVLYPRKSLVVNIGFDGVGTHSIRVDEERYGTSYSTVPVQRYPNVTPNVRALEAIANFLSRDGSLLMRVRRKFIRLVSSALPK